MAAHDPEERLERSRPGQRHAAPVEEALAQGADAVRRTIDEHEAAGEAARDEADAQAAEDAQARDDAP